MNASQSQQRAGDSDALDNEDRLQGLEIDGYKIEFSKRVALMPVDLVSSEREPTSRDDE